MSKYYIGHYLTELKDGGQARNKAFKDFLQSKNPQLKIINVFSNNWFKRMFFAVKTALLLLYKKNSTFFIHQGSLLVLLPEKLRTVEFSLQILYKLLTLASKNNNLIIEVNDLPFEQMKDLQLPVSQSYKLFQLRLYSLKEARFIFASHKMAAYATQHYGIDPAKVEVLINGGPNNEKKGIEKLHPADKSKVARFVYAGSLNRGRQIEELVDLFKGRAEKLLLIGDWGEWLKHINLPENIQHIGPLEESAAHAIASTCDMGLIPYASDKFYYNLCYPTKASFYITAGIPFLSTPVEELQDVFTKHDKCAIFLPFADWEPLLNKIKEEEIKTLKVNVQKIKGSFLWSNLLNKSHLLKSLQ